MSLSLSLCEDEMRGYFIKFHLLTLDFQTTENDFLYLCDHSKDSAVMPHTGDSSLSYDPKSSLPVVIIEIENLHLMFQCDISGPHQKSMLTLVFAFIFIRCYLKCAVKALNAPVLLFSLLEINVEKK